MEDFISKIGFKKKWLVDPDLKDWIKYDEAKDAVFCNKCLIVEPFKQKGCQTGFNQDGYKGGGKRIQKCDLKDHIKSNAHTKCLSIISQKSNFKIAQTTTIKDERS